MNRNMFLTSNSLREAFNRFFLISAVSFILSVVVGTIAAQFADFSSFEYSSVYHSANSNVWSVVVSAFSCSRMFILVFLLAFFAGGFFLMPAAVFLYGFSFSYALVYFVTSTAFLTDFQFYDFIFSFLILLPSLLVCASYSAAYSLESRSGSDKVVGKFILPFFILFLFCLLFTVIVKLLVYFAYVIFV